MYQHQPYTLHPPPLPRNPPQPTERHIPITVSVPLESPYSLVPYQPNIQNPSTNCAASSSSTAISPCSASSISYRKRQRTGQVPFPSSSATSTIDIDDTLMELPSGEV